MDEEKPVAGVPTAEHREPCESRGSRTVLGAPGGEIPPGNSPFAPSHPRVRAAAIGGRPAAATYGWRGGS